MLSNEVLEAAKRGEFGGFSFQSVVERCIAYLIPHLAFVVSRCFTVIKLLVIERAWCSADSARCSVQVFNLYVTIRFDRAACRTFIDAP